MWGRAKLGPLVRAEGFTASNSTVGRILADLVARGVVEPVPTLRRRPYARRWTAKRRFARRLPRDLAVREPGGLVQLDTVFVNLTPTKAIKHFTAYDPIAKWTVAKAFNRATAQAAASFLNKIIADMPFPVKASASSRFADYRGGFEASGSVMPRLFTGLELPQRVTHQIASARGGIVGARWIEPSDYHITLRFLGDIDSHLARDAFEILSEICRPAAPRIQFDGFDSFGGGRPRALILRVKAERELIDLQAEQERRLRRIGLVPETRKYLPHVTLARLRGPDSRAVADYLAIRGVLAVEPFTPDRFVLYSSRASVGGGPYVVEAGFPLG